MVHAIVRPGNKKPLPNGVDVFEVPLDPSRLAAAMHLSSVVVHCAGVIRAKNAQGFKRVNVDGTRAVVDAANRTRNRVILISSQAAGGVGTPARPRREDDPSEPVNAYGASKVQAEQVVREQSRTEWVILRPCAVYGPRDRGFLPLFRLANRGWFFLLTNPEMPFTLIDVGDLATAIVLAADSEKAVGETCFVGHPTPQTTEDILRMLAHVLHKPYRPRSLPQTLFKLAASAGELAWNLGVELPIDHSRYKEFTSEGFVCSVDRARDVLGFTAATSFEEGIARTARWYKDKRWI